MKGDWLWSDVFDWPIHIILNEFKISRQNLNMQTVSFSRGGPKNLPLTLTPLTLTPHCSSRVGASTQRNSRPFLSG